MTDQFPDRLRFNRRIHNLFSEPLESYFDDKHPKPKAFESNCTACWRGYIAGWCIQHGKLYLEKLDAFCYDSPSIDDIAFTFDAASGLNAPIPPNYLTQLFPESAAPVFADWFSGELCYLPLKFYIGKLVSEWDALQAASVMQIEHGRIVERAQDGSD